MGAASTQAFCTRLPVDPLVAIPLARAAIDTAVRKSNLPTRFDWLPAVSVRVVDIFKRRGIADLDPPRQAGERVGERKGAGPAHPAEDGRQMPRVTRANEPKSAILGRAENQIVLAENAESFGDVTGTQRRNIRPDEDCRARRTGRERALHAGPEVALALSDRLDPLAPMTGVLTGPVRRYRDPQTPAAVPRQAAQQPRDHHPLEPHRPDIADLPSEAALTAAELRRPHEQNESAAHQR